MTWKPTSDQWKRIQDLFLELADLPASEQESRLAEQQGSDPDIANEVRSLLSHDDDQLPFAPSESISTGVPALGRLRTPGHQVDQFQLTIPISIGHSSEVWKAQRVSAEPALTQLEPIVAIKFLCETLDTRDDQARRQVLRFAREAHLLSRFRHQGIASYISCGQDADRSPYIAMEFVDGLPITEFADRNRLDCTARLNLMIQVAAAVQYAHQFQVVHSDLKPDNILVTEDKQVVILDFGISKQLQNAETSDTKPLNLTTTQFRPMTPGYASPEQVRGDQISTATDVHAMGIVMYELLSGHHPFSEPAHPNIPHFQDRICSSTPKKPSEVVSAIVIPIDSDSQAESTTPMEIADRRQLDSSRQLNRTLKGDLDWVVMKALEKEPANRYLEVTGMATDLKRIAGGQTLARNETNALTTQIRKRPIGSVAFASAFAALLTGLVFYMSGMIGQSTSSDQGTQSSNNQVNSKSSALDEQTIFRSRLSSFIEGSPSNEEIELDADMIAKMPVSSRIEWAELMIQQGRYSTAEDFAIAANTKTKLGPSERLRNAALWQKLGRPTAGLQSLGDFNDVCNQPELQQLGLANSASAQQVLMLLLADAGMNTRAAKVSETIPSDWKEVESQATHRLLLANTRANIAWLDTESINAIVKNRLPLTSRKTIGIYLV